MNDLSRTITSLIDYVKRHLSIRGTASQSSVLPTHSEDQAVYDAVDRMIRSGEVDSTIILTEEGLLDGESASLLESCLQEKLRRAEENYTSSMDMINQQLGKEESTSNVEVSILSAEEVKAGKESLAGTISFSVEVLNYPAIQKILGSLGQLTESDWKKAESILWSNLTLLDQLASVLESTKHHMTVGPGLVYDHPTPLKRVSQISQVSKREPFTAIHKIWMASPSDTFQDPTALEQVTLLISGSVGKVQ